MRYLIRFATEWSFGGASTLPLSVTPHPPNGDRFLFLVFTSVYLHRPERSDKNESKRGSDVDDDDGGRRAALDADSASAKGVGLLPAKGQKLIMGERGGKRWWS